MWLDGGVGGVSGRHVCSQHPHGLRPSFSVPEREYSVQQQHKTGINSGLMLQDLNILLKADSFIRCLILAAAECKGKNNNSSSFI